MLGVVAGEFSTVPLLDAVHDLQGRSGGAALGVDASGQLARVSGGSSLRVLRQLLAQAGDFSPIGIAIVSATRTFCLAS
ncbi:hypothetical protein C5C00_13380 [Rathayibacter rathayi]|nr:hypothetical protein [Rathayibacter rathayi]PPF20724.1 hypothetical protein C5C34_14185 [Rathayibacter rathayi]PPG10738.1 hypothetical protein C5C11_13620 [Rathayibacter rathayi]PPG85349.1 hypothetical protein C5C47_13700 [Rathayibacter rathayi]PPG91910.1 hypothetical protein C5C22_13575 [Rathayibacter rathayi]PPG93698.1 hypothetical protein C5C00_13380 [Rathayibacter rathayi]